MLIMMQYTIPEEILRNEMQALIEHETFDKLTVGSKSNRGADHYTTTDPERTLALLKKYAPNLHGWLVWLNMDGKANASGPWLTHAPRSSRIPGSTSGLNHYSHGDGYYPAPIPVESIPVSYRGLFAVGDGYTDWKLMTFQNRADSRFFSVVSICMCMLSYFNMKYL